MVKIFYGFVVINNFCILAPKQSLFAKARLQNQSQSKEIETKSSTTESNNTKLIFEEIHQKIVGNETDDVTTKTITDIVMGDIVEKTVHQLKPQRIEAPLPKIPKISCQIGKLLICLGVFVIMPKSWILSNSESIWISCNLVAF